VAKRFTGDKGTDGQDVWKMVVGGVWFLILLGVLVLIALLFRNPQLTNPSFSLSGRLVSAGLLGNTPLTGTPSPTPLLMGDPPMAEFFSLAPMPGLAVKKSLGEMALLQPTLRPVTLTLTPTRTPTPTSTRLPFFEGPMVIGHSVEGRPLEVYRFGVGSEARMIVAGIHGGYEWNTAALADELIAHLIEHPEIIPAGIRLYILRVLNPDGLERSLGYAGRANSRGVDLNRNWPAQWAEDWPREQCWNMLPITAGPYPASEPETHALLEFIKNHRIKALISYHSAALGIFPGGVPPYPPSIDLAEAIAAVTDYPYPPWGGGCVYTGNLVDWAAKAGIPGVDVELHTHEYTDFEINLRVLGVFLNWQPKILFPALP
jgi:hypothetical protein